MRAHPPTKTEKDKTLLGHSVSRIPTPSKFVT